MPPNGQEKINDLLGRPLTRRSALTGILASVSVPGALAALLEACGGQSGGNATTSPIKMGVEFGLTGIGAFVANAGKNGVTLALEEINKAGINGRRIESSLQDTMSQPSEAINIFRRFVTEQNTKLIIGPQTSTEVLAALPVSQELKAISITPMCTNPSITKKQGKGGNPYMFRVNPPADSQAQTFIKLVALSLGDKRLSIVARNDDLGRGAAAAYQSAAKQFGAEVTSTNFFQTGGSYDFSSALTRVKSEKPQGVVFIGTIEEGVPFIKQFYEQGVSARIYTDSVSITSALYQQLGPKLVAGLHAVAPYFAEIDTPDNKSFVAKWRARFNADPIFQGYFSYAAVHLLARAIAKAGTDNPEKVKDALKQVVYPGVTGELKFDDYNQAHPQVYIGRVDCSGASCGVKVIASAPSVAAA